MRAAVIVWRESGRRRTFGDVGPSTMGTKMVGRTRAPTTGKWRAVSREGVNTDLRVGRRDCRLHGRCASWRMAWSPCYVCDDVRGIVGIARLLVPGQRYIRYEVFAISVCRWSDHRGILWMVSAL